MTSVLVRGIDVLGPEVVIRLLEKGYDVRVMTNVEWAQAQMLTGEEAGNLSMPLRSSSLCKSDRSI